MNDAKDDYLSVTHQMGGVIEFQRTGVYPDKLIIYSLKYNHIWRIKVKKDFQEGVLKIKKVPVYNYKFDNEAFYYQNPENGTTVSDWIPVGEMIIIMAD